MSIESKVKNNQNLSGNLPLSRTVWLLDKGDHFEIDGKKVVVDNRSFSHVGSQPDHPGGFTLQVSYSEVSK